MITREDLTFEVKDGGYTIFLNGVAWVVQPKGLIPYLAETIEESAQLHIDEILSNFETIVQELPAE